MKFYVFLLFFSYSSALDFDCLKGPSYWCANEENAVRCDRIIECSTTNQGVNKMSKTEDNYQCKLCKEVVSALESKILQQFTDEQFISYVVNNVCTKLEKEMQQMCESLVHKYGHDIYVELRSFVDPGSVCSYLQVCNTDKTIMKSMDMCKTCKKVCMYLGDLLASVTPSEIKAVLKLVCDKLPLGFRTMCNTLVDGYIEQLYELLKSLLDGGRICPVLHLCSTETKNKLSDWQSETCLDVITVLKKDLANVADNQVISIAESRICSKVPDLFKGLCHNLIGQNIGPLLNKIHSGMTPSQICAQTFTGLFKSLENKESSVRSMIECDACELIVRTLRKFLNSKQGELTLINFIKTRICKYLGSNKQKCMDYVDKYGHLVIDFINSQLTDRQLCELFGVCASPQLLLSDSPTIIGGVECDTCQMILKKVKTFIFNPTNQVKLKNVLKNKICPLFKQEETECLQIMDDYYTLIIDAIMSELDVDSICKYGGFCPQTFVSNNAECKVCELALNDVIHLVVTKESQQQIEDFLTKVVYPKFNYMKEECAFAVKKYIPVIFSMVREDGNSAILCSRLNLCSLVTHNNVGSFMNSFKQKSSKCDMCKFMINEIIVLLSDSTSRIALEDFLKTTVCPRLGVKKQECEIEITKYYSLLINVVLKVLSPNICNEIMLCEVIQKVPTIETPKLIIKAKRSIECDVCPRIYMFLKRIDEKEITSDIILGIIEICGHYSNEEKQKCLLVLKKVDFLVDSVKKTKNELEFCEMSKMCSSKTIIRELKKCAYGPGFWCISKRNAEFCGIAAVRHCEFKVWKINKTN